MVEEQTLEEQEIQVPPYYERFLEERDRRFSSEIARVETQVRHNGQRIDELTAAVTRLDGKIEDVRTELKTDIAEVRTELKADIARLDSRIENVRTELKADIAHLDGKIENVRTELKADIAAVRTELKADIARLESKLDSHFRWMLGLLLPVILGVVALLIQSLLTSP